MSGMGGWKRHVMRKKSSSRTTSSRGKIYIAVPPKEGWPAFTGTNWAALGLRLKGNR